MSKLLTAREIIKNEAEYRLNVLKMPKRKVAVSLGYDVRSFRKLWKRLNEEPDYRPRLNTLSEKKLVTRSYSKENRE